MISILRSFLVALGFAAAALVVGAHSFAKALDTAPSCTVPGCPDARP